MTFNVAQSTCRNNVKPMFLGIPKVVMPVVRLLIAIDTYHCLRFLKNTCFNCSADCISGFYSFRMNKIIFFMSFFLIYTSLFTFSIQLGLSFADRCFLIVFMIIFIFTRSLIYISPFFMFFGFSFFFAINYHARFTFVLFPKCISPVVMKLRNWFNFLASRTFSCYNSLRHGFFLIKKLCFEPLEGQPLCGSLYYTMFLEGCQ